MMHCCISVFGKTADIASGKPVSPSMQVIKISSTPRLFKPLRMESQYFALSFSPTYMPKTSFFAVHIDSDCYIYGFFHDSALTADVVMNSIHKHYCIDIFERSLLPLFHNRKNFIRDSANKAVRYFKSIDILDV